MYFTTLPGKLKLIIIAIGFIAVNIGSNAAFNSDVYVRYRKAYLEAVESIEPKSYGRLSVCNYVEEKLEDEDKQLKANITTYHKIEEKILKLEESVKKNETRQEELEAEKKKKDEVFEKIKLLEISVDQSEMLRRSICDPPPSWVVNQFIFVSFAIITLVVEVMSFTVGMYMESNPRVKDKEIRKVDGMVHFLMGIVIFVGSVCLLTGMQTNLDSDGFNEKYPEMSVFHEIKDETIFELQEGQKALEYGHKMKKKALEQRKDQIKRKAKPSGPYGHLLTTGDVEQEEKRLDDKLKSDKLAYSIRVRQIRRQVRYNEKIAASAFGFLNTIMYFFSCGLIGRGITSIPFK